MATFNVTFQLKSYYADESLDKETLVTNDYEADSLDELFETLDDTDELDQIDDDSVINHESDEEPEEINIEYVLIHDGSGKEVYRDEDYSE